MSVLAPLIYISVPIAAAAYLFIIFFKIKEAEVWVKAWLAFVIVATLVPNIWVIYITIVFVGIKVIPSDDESRIFYYIALLCALPKMPFFVPFPGIEGILIMRYNMLLGLVLLLPVYLRMRGRGEPLSKIDKLVLVYIVLSTILDFRDDTSITQTARGVITNFIALWLPYRVVSQSKSDLRRHLLAIMLMGVALAFESVVEWAVVWKTYASIAQNVPGLIISPLQFAYYFRGLGLRVSSSWLTAITFGMYMAMTCYMVINMHKVGIKRNILTWLVVAVVFLALMFTDSRGALLMLILAMFANFYFYKNSKGWKSTFKFVSMVGVIIVFTNLQALYDIDTSGSFQYRADLITYSEDAFNRAPILGSPTFRENPVLVANMTQGQGIVDIVNHYLKVALRYGLLGLAIYMAIWISVISGVAKRASYLQSINDDRYLPGSMLTSMLVGMAVVIYTVSLVGYLEELIYIMIAIGSAYLKNTEK